MSEHTPMTPEQLAEIAAIAASAASDPLLFSDCEGQLRVWRESALLNIVRDEAGAITGWREPFSYRPSDLILDAELSTWDEGEDEDDDRLRLVVEHMVRARALMPALRDELDARQRRIDELVDQRDAALIDLADNGLAGTVHDDEADTDSPPLSAAGRRAVAGLMDATEARLHLIDEDDEDEAGEGR